MTRRTKGNPIGEFSKIFMGFICPFKSFSFMGSIKFTKRCFSFMFINPFMQSVVSDLISFPCITFSLCPVTPRTFSRTKFTQSFFKKIGKSFKFFSAFQTVFKSFGIFPIPMFFPRSVSFQSFIPTRYSNSSFRKTFTRTINRKSFSVWQINRIKSFITSRANSEFSEFSHNSRLA